MKKKEVYFDQYCKSCKYHGLEESKDPCNDCLAEPSNTNSHKPMNYESKTILDAEKKDAIDIATELCYSEEVKRKIAQANPFTKLVASLNRHGSIQSDISERRKRNMNLEEFRKGTFVRCYRRECTTEKDSCQTFRLNTMKTFKTRK